MNKIIVFMGNPFELSAVKDLKKHGFKIALAGTDINDNLVFHAVHEEAKDQIKHALEYCSHVLPVKTIGHIPEIGFYVYKNPELNSFYFLAGEYFELTTCRNREQFDKTEQLIEQHFFTDKM